MKTVAREETFLAKMPDPSFNPFWVAKPDSDRVPTETQLLTLRVLLNFVKRLNI